MNDHSNINERAWALLNGELDGELSGAEQQELDALLAASEELRTVQAELHGMKDCLQQVPDKEPPDYLHNTITSTVRLPVDVSEKSTNGISSWLSRSWVAPAFALTAGVLLTVGIYESNFESYDVSDTAGMSGTILNSNGDSKSQVIDHFEIEKAELYGTAKLRKSGQNYLVDVRVDTDLPAMLTVNYIDNDLKFMGVVSITSPVEGVMVSDQKVTVEGKGDQQYTLMFANPEGQLAANSDPLIMGWSINYAVPIEAELQVVKK